MAEASELFGADNPMASDLEQGRRTIALDQKIKFRLYGRVVLPADGFVFWVLAPLLKQVPFTPPNPGLVSAAELSDEEMESCTVEVPCSLHYTTDFRQDESESYAANRVAMTTREEVREFGEIAPRTMYVGEHAGMRFGFSSQSSRYQQAALWHYSGFALYSDMDTQLVERVQDFSPDLVVSNSLPAWLAIQGWAPPWKFWRDLPPMFPSFAVPDNEPPPYMSVHVVPEATQALASAPTLLADSSQVQLARDTVRITMYGVRNEGAMDLIAAAYSYIENAGVLGLMDDLPTIRDEKRTQAEMRTIAQKKSVQFTVSYLQGAMRTVSRQVLRKAAPRLYVEDRFVAGPPLPPAPP